MYPKMIVNGTKKKCFRKKKKKGDMAGKAGSEIRNRIGKQNLQPFYQKKENVAVLS